MPRSRAPRTTRSAISPRFATSSLRNRGRSWLIGVRPPLCIPRGAATRAASLMSAHHNRRRAREVWHGSSFVCRCFPGACSHRRRGVGEEGAEGDHGPEMQDVFFSGPLAGARREAARRKPPCSLGIFPSHAESWGCLGVHRRASGRIWAHLGAGIRHELARSFTIFHGLSRARGGRQSDPGDTLYAVHDHSLAVDARGSQQSCRNARSI